MSIADAVEAPVVPSRRRRRWRRLAMLLIVVGSLTAAFFWWDWKAERELNAVIASVDRTDPAWRWEDLEATRRAVPDEQNSAQHVAAAFAALPERLPGFDSLLIDLPAAPAQLSAAESAQLRRIHDLSERMLTLARPLAEMPHGRYPMAWSPEKFHEMPASYHSLRSIVPLLLAEAMREAQQDDATMALFWCRVALNAARSVGDEPMLVPQQERHYFCLRVARVVERVLSQGEPSGPSLASLQALLADEENHRGLRVGLRGERAMWHKLLEAVEAGTIDLPTLNSPYHRGDDISRPPGAGAIRFLARPRVKEFHATALRQYTDYLEIATLPADEQVVRLAEMPPLPEYSQSYYIVAVRAQSISTEQSGSALLRCAIAALAAERFRRINGRWPTALDELCPRFLAQVPLDPYDGKPLRLCRVTEGVVIYSIGPDLTDNNGNLVRNRRATPGTDIGFELWDVNKRRQPPPAGGFMGPFPRSSALDGPEDRLL
ncbi:MAG: hypothetical protein K2R98_00210 [Gemmataceae bacterium]|nr:hypothetical protein [Gemmataceae bacterium]